MKPISLFADINAEGTTLVMATHDQIIVDKMQKRVSTLDHGHLIGDTIGVAAMKMYSSATFFRRLSNR